MALGLVLAWVLSGGGATAATGPTAFDEPVTSVDEIADRLAAYAAGDETGLAPTLGGQVSSCDEVSTSSPDAGSPTPPEHVPSYKARLALPGLSEPVNVRFWLVDPAQAQRFVDEAQQAARACTERGKMAGGYGGAGRSDVFPASQRRAGWRWSQAVEIGRVGMDTDPSYLFRPFVQERVVAARGALLAEIAWYDEGMPGMPAAPWARSNGERVTAAILAAVGGDPSRPAPTTVDTRARTARLAAALPKRSAYGDDVRPGKVTMLCGNDPTRFVGPGPDGPATGVIRSSAGPVGVTEAISVYADGEAADRRLRKAHEAMMDRQRYPRDVWTCGNHVRDKVSGVFEPVGDPRPEVSTPYRAGPFRHGPWTGHLETVAARLNDLPEDHGYRDSVAHVRVVARDGTTVADLTWEAPAGTDLEGTLRRGEAALRRTFDALAG